MPKTTKAGKAKKEELPSTVARSPKKAQRTFAKAHDSAAESYGEGERAHRTAYSALKHSFEKVGDHWEPKGKKGPSDAQAAKGGAAGKRQYETKGGVDAQAPKSHLLDVAKRLDISGRTRMNKAELVEAINKANRRETARSRQR
jgi:cation transport regulator ChaB